MNIMNITVAGTGEGISRSVSNKHCFCPPPFEKAGDIKSHVFQSLCHDQSVTKTLTWLISSEIF